MWMRRGIIASTYFNLKNEIACGGAIPLNTIENFITKGKLRDFKL
jgi:hypothetical protein